MEVGSIIIATVLMTALYFTIGVGVNQLLSKAADGEHGGIAVILIWPIILVFASFK